MRAAVTVIFFTVLGVIDACSSNTMDEGCYTDADCGQGYLCEQATGACLDSTDSYTHACTVPSDCSASYTCGKDGRCLPGDCYFHGCVSGFECESSTGAWECLPNSAGAAGASGTEDNSEAGSGGV